MQVLPTLHRFRWPLGIGIATLIAVGGGAIVGNDAAADIAPFYANVVAPKVKPAPEDTTSYASTMGDGNSSADVADLSYARATGADDNDHMQP